MRMTLRVHASQTFGVSVQAASPVRVVRMGGQDERLMPRGAPRRLIVFILSILSGLPMPRRERLPTISQLVSV